MASPSKEENVLKLILENSPLKEWHFEDVVRTAKVTRVVANKWLKKYVKERLLRYTKKKGSFPYFSAGSNNPVYYSLKRVYALEQLHKSGLIPRLLSLTTAKTVILFGSIVKGDWYKDSDIDIFIFGDIAGFDKARYEHKLHKNIELHLFQNKEELEEVKTGLITNVINGYIIKGRIQDIVKVG